MPIKKHQTRDHHILIKDIMTKNVATVAPDTSLIAASDKMISSEFNGLPVVDKDHKVVGIITEYDLLSRGTAIHIPTFIRLMSEFPTKKRRESLLFKKSFEEMVSFSVRDVMNKDPIIMWEGSTFSNILRVLSDHHRVNPNPIVNAKGKLVGIVSRFDVIRYFSGFLKELKHK
ncbi:MAG: CBS domain-containing protein [Patescibacteria group bacterium]